tara:strand:- start:3521 stop:4423 length:903 start_codon:yes stop_codon:yes gene_type:complete
MKNFLRKVIIKIVNFIDSKLFWIKCDYFFKGKINLNIYNLHSTRPKDFNYYKKILKYIDKRSKFINPQDIENLSTTNFKNSNYSILTFDDGYRDNHEFALTILKELNIKAIFFIIPKFIHEKNKFSEEYLNKLYPEKRYEINAERKLIFQHMNYSQINNLLMEGHQIGIHGFEHEDYGKIKLMQIKKKINQSKNILEKFNIRTNHFAYPFGSSKNFSNDSNKILSKYFRFIYTGVRGINSLSNIRSYKSYIFKRQTLSTHKEDLVYFPIKLEEVYFFSFNKIIKFIYMLIRIFSQKKYEE